MPLWKPGKSPEIYPLSFRQAIAQVGRHVVAVCGEENTAKYERKRFSAFRCNLKEHPLHELFPKLEAFRTRTFVERLDDGRFAVIVETREGFLRSITEQLGELL